MLGVYRLLHNVGGINHTLFGIGRIHEVRRMYIPPETGSTLNSLQAEPRGRSFTVW